MSLFAVTLHPIDRFRKDKIIVAEPTLLDEFIIFRAVVTIGETLIAVCVLDILKMVVVLAV